jgi:Leucine-rich repeat (LRR) protein
MKTKLLLLLLLANFSIYSQINLVPNGDFAATNGVIQTWTIANVVNSNYDYASSQFSAKLSYTTVSPKITTLVPMKAGVTYTVKYKYKYISSNYSGDHPISLNISQNGSASTLSSSTFATNNLWTEKSTTFTADSDLSYNLSISTFSFDSAAYDVLIDDVQVYVQGTEQLTSIPDVEFEKKLIALGIDFGATDGKVPTININSIKTLDISNSLITDLTGIADFKSLTALNCSSNKLTSLDISNNTTLTLLDCSYNFIKALDLAKNTNLTFLDCTSNQLPSLNVSANTALQYMQIGNNGNASNTISSLDLSQNINLLELTVRNLRLTSLDLSKNTALKKLDCAYLNSGTLSSLDVSANTQLESLIVHTNNLTSLDVSKNKSLKRLICYYNQITSLDLSGNNALILLSCSDNKLNNVNLKNGNNSNLLTTGSVPFRYFSGDRTIYYDSTFKNNPNLFCVQVDDVAYSQTNWTKLKDDVTFFSLIDCGLYTKITDSKFEDKLIALQIDKDGKNGAVLTSAINTVTSLDVSNSSITDLTGIQDFAALTNLNASTNLLKRLDVSKNTALNTLNTSTNPSLTCIQVANVAATANWTVTKDATASFNLDCTPYTLIPDANFEDKLIALQIDKDGKNGKVKTESISTVTALDISSSSISDLTGIQDFSSLTELRAYNNNLTAVDVTKNTKLTTLRVGTNQLTTLNVSQNTALTYLDFSQNKITTIDLAKNTELTYFGASSNLLSTIDLSQNTKIGALFLHSNMLVSLDVSKNLSLNQLWCFENQIRTLDFSQNTKLVEVLANTNRLINLNIKNGKNIQLGGSNGGVRFTQNPELKCIQVDDVNYSNANWGSKKDVTAIYSVATCPVVEAFTLIPDPNFEDKLIALQIDKDGKNGKVATTNVAYLTTLNVSNSNISDLTGIEDFASLTSLECNNNQLKTINVSKNRALTKLNVSKNQLTVLSVSENTLLNNLNCSSNAILVLDVSKNIALNNLSASFNKIQYLDVSANKTLKELDCAANDLYNLNLKNGNNANMQNVIFGNFTQNPNLLCIQVDDAAFSTANWIAKDATANYSTTACEKNYQYTLIPDSNFENVLIAKGIDIDGKNGKVRTESIAKLKQLTTYDSSNIITDLTGIQDFTELEELSCNSGKLAKLDVSKNLKLKILSCSNNQLTSLDLSKNLNLTSLNANTNSLTALDVSANTALVTLLVSGNKLTTINIDSNDKLRSINLSNNLLTAVNLSKNALLTQITISNNKIANLDLSENFSLQNLNASYNLLTGINLSSNTALLSVELSSNQLKNISLSQNLALTSLTASYNVLPGIDVSKNTALTYLDLSANQITTIDLSSNTALGQLYIGSNRLSVLELAKNTELTYVYCYNNIIRTLDFSKNTKLTNAFVYSNKLVNLNLKNGKNTLIKDLSAATNSDLTCIQVDDVAYSNTNWANKKDATASYSSDACPVVVPYTLIPDSKFEDKLIALQIDKDGKNGKVATMSIATLTSLDVSKSEIADLTGLQDFNLLTTLNVSNNVLTTINISKNTYLTSLNVSNNKLTTLVVPATIPVSNLNCSNNEIATLDVSKNTSLTYLSASFNKLKTLDVSKNTILKEFDCAGNDLYNLNLKNGNNANMQRMIFGNFTQNPNLLCIQVDDAAFSNDNWIAKDATATYSTEVCQTNYQYTLIPDLNFEKVLIKNGIDKDGENGKVRTESIAKLTQLSAYDSTNKITDLTGIQDFAELETLDCSNGAIKVLDISKNLKLKSVNCSYNALTTLDVSKNAALTVLNASANQLTSVNVSSNLALTNLSLSNNQLTTVNVANNTALKSLALANNQLTSIDVNKNSALTILDLFTNKLTSVDILNNTALTTLNVAYNQLTSFDVSKNTLLTSFSGASNQLTSIDLSKLTVLKGLDLANNKLTSLDIATNPALLSLYVQGNNLTSLNLKNGKNTLLTNYNISFKSNPKLTCILVDDVTFANNNWSGNKDVTATYNTECTGELVLPANNFAIETKGESCLGENNGEISIVAKTAFDYTATINDKPYAFVSNSLKVAALAPGVYKIKITIPGMIFEQNFNVTIAKGATITGKSSIASKKVDVEITEGTAPFTVFVDGNEQFQTTASNFSIELNEGGLIEVVTSKACEGVYAKKIKTTDILGTVLSAYPNPTNGSFEIEIPTDKNEVTIELYNFGGQLVSRKAYVIENGTAKLNLENQPSGIYAAKIYLETPEYIKIIKK